MRKLIGKSRLAIALTGAVMLGVLPAVSVAAHTIDDAKVPKDANDVSGPLDVRKSFLCHTTKLYCPESKRFYRKKLIFFVTTYQGWDPQYLGSTWDGETSFNISVDTTGNNKKADRLIHVVYRKKLKAFVRWGNETHAVLPVEHNETNLLIRVPRDLLRPIDGPLGWRVQTVDVETGENDYAPDLQDGEATYYRHKV